MPDITQNITQGGWQKGGMKLVKRQMPALLPTDPEPVSFCVSFVESLLELTHLDVEALLSSTTGLFSKTKLFLVIS